MMLAIDFIDSLTGQELDDIQLVAYNAYDDAQGSLEVYGKVFRAELTKLLDKREST